MKTKFKISVLEGLMKLPTLPRFGLKYKIFLDNILNLFKRGNFGNILPNINKRPKEFKLIIKQLNKDKLHLGMKLPNFQGHQILLLKLPNNIRIIRNH
jgi:hypothetical protein